MNAVNLIPASRQTVRRRRARIQRWVMINATYALVVVALCVAAGYSAVDAGQSRARLADLEAQATALQSDVSLLSSALSDAKAMLAASRLLRQQPDWSILTALLAVKAGDRIVLADVTLSAAADSASGRPANDASVCSSPVHDYLLQIRAYARTQADAAQFAMRLEQTGLFDHVRIRRAARQNYAGEDAVNFELDCGMIEGGGLRP